MISFSFFFSSLSHRPLHNTRHCSRIHRINYSLPMSNSISNDTLRTRIDGLYLGDKGLANTTTWRYSKDARSFMLMKRPTSNRVAPEPITLHGVFSISHNSFRLLPDSGYNPKYKPSFHAHLSNEEALAKANASAQFSQAPKGTFGHSDFDTYLTNLKAFEIQTGQAASADESIIKSFGLDQQIKLSHKMIIVSVSR